MQIIILVLYTVRVMGIASNKNCHVVMAASNLSKEIVPTKRV